MASLETDACKLWRVLRDNMFVLFTIVRAQGFHAQIAALFSSWHREPTVRGFLKKETALLLQRTITPRFPGQRQAWPDQQMVAIAASLARPLRFKFWTQICLPTQFTLDRGNWGRVRLSVLGVLVMGIEHLPRNKQRRPAEPSLRVVENTDCAVSLPEENDARSLWGGQHSYDIHSLLEENALLRRILVKMDLVLKKVVDPK
jgi:hypothetical protein